MCRCRHWRYTRNRRKTLASWKGQRKVKLVGGIITGLVRSAKRAVARPRRDMGSARRLGWYSSQQVTTVGPSELGRWHVSIDLKGGIHGGIWKKSILIKKGTALQSPETGGASCVGAVCQGVPIKG